MAGLEFGPSKKQNKTKHTHARHKHKNLKDKIVCEYPDEKVLYSFFLYILSSGAESSAVWEAASPSWRGTISTIFPFSQFLF